MLEFLYNTNFNSYYVPLANKIGVLESIYISTLCSLYKESITSAYTPIDRKAIYNISAISIKDQYTLDSKLSPLNIIMISPNGDIDSIGINITNINNILNPVTTNEPFNAFPASNSNNNSNNTTTTKYSEGDRILAAVKSHIRTKDPDIWILYSNWLVMHSIQRGYVSKNILSSTEDKINSYANGDKNIIKDILNIAITNNIVSIDTAINIYNDKHRKQIPKEDNVDYSIVY